MTAPTPYAARPDLGQHLATVASTLRDLAGGAHWDVPGVRAEIHRAKHLAAPDQLAHAVIAWATSRLDLRAPIGLADDGLWWHTGRTPDTRVVATRCDLPGHGSYPATNCGACRAEQLEGTHPGTTPTPDPDAADIAARGARQVRAALEAARGRRHQDATGAAS